MLLSMTGYGRASKEFGPKAYTIEVKTLNSKYTDVKARLPQGYRAHEMEIRRIVTEKVKRGKVDVLIEIKFLQADQAIAFDKEVFKAYYKELKSLSDEMNIEHADYVQSILRLPNVATAGEEVIEKEEWEICKSVLHEALDKLTKYRADEGASLEADFRLRVKNIGDLLEQIEPHEQGRIDRIKERFRTQLTDIINNYSVDDNRLEQEMVFYTEKYSISEEKVRLSQHLAYFIEQLDQNKGKEIGRRLSFISQEMGREINTLGSKANCAEIQRLVVRMKDELEKIKEQVANAV